MHRSEARPYAVMTTSIFWLLRRPVESAQYASEDYRNVIRSAGFKASMSRKGNCYDNAPMESFFHTLKTELVHHRHYATRSEATRDVFAYIEGFYNRTRGDGVKQMSTKLRIFLVEDEAMIRMMVVDMLEELGHQSFASLRDERSFRLRIILRRPTIAATVRWSAFAITARGAP
jgi:hypothetical protein